MAAATFSAQASAAARVATTSRSSTSMKVRRHPYNVQIAAGRALGAQPRAYLHPMPMRCRWLPVWPSAQLPRPPQPPASPATACRPRPPAAALAALPSPPRPRSAPACAGALVLLVVSVASVVRTRLSMFRAPGFAAIIASAVKHLQPHALSQQPTACAQLLRLARLCHRVSQSLGRLLSTSRNAAARPSLFVLCLPSYRLLLTLCLFLLLFSGSPFFVPSDWRHPGGVPAGG